MVALSNIGIGAMCAFVGVMCGGIFFLMKMLASWDQLLGNAEESNDKEEKLQRRFITKLIRIPAKSIGAVLGRGGANVRRVEFETKTFIRIVYSDKNIDARRKASSHDQIGNNVGEDWFANERTSRRPDDEGTFVEIRGENKEQIRLACLAVRGLVADSLMPQITKHLCAEPHVVGSIIGKDGTNLRRLQRNFKVNVEIDNNTGNSLRKISITGTEEAVSQAEARIMQLMSRGRQNSLNAANVDELPFEEWMSEVALLKTQCEEGEDEVWC
ncbi:hypothetical protein RB195_013907 [Necator americanus]|uniref:K Homology domain-containing protein n=1 Tax=Necator americanus TaxID=51031 RepID=A0ABR1DXP4_NECAM